MTGQQIKYIKQERCCALVIQNLGFAAVAPFFKYGLKTGEVPRFNISRFATHTVKIFPYYYFPASRDIHCNSIRFNPLSFHLKFYHASGTFIYTDDFEIYILLPHAVVHALTRDINLY